MILNMVNLYQFFTFLIQLNIKTWWYMYSLHMHFSFINGTFGSTTCKDMLEVWLAGPELLSVKETGLLSNWLLWPLICTRAGFYPTSVWWSKNSFFNEFALVVCSGSYFNTPLISPTIAQIDQSFGATHPGGKHVCNWKVFSLYARSWRVTRHIRPGHWVTLSALLRCFLLYTVNSRSCGRRPRFKYGRHTFS